MHQTRTNARTLSGNSRGEIAVTFTVVSLVLMIVGTTLGLGVNKSQDVRTRAAGAFCGKTCSTRGDCGTDSTTGTATTCDTRIKKCVAVRDPKNPPCIASAGNTLQECNQHCDNTEQCNGTDTSTGIALACDMRSHTCQQKYVNDPRQCPGYISPTPRTGTSTGTGSDGSFKSSSLSCGVGFRVVVDPLINSITLSGSGGSYQIGRADIVKPDGTGFNGPADPIAYRMWQPATGDPSDNLLIEWNPTNTYPAGIPKGALHVRVKSGNPVNEHSKINPVIDFYYFNNLPAWLKNGSPVTVTFKYYVLSGLQSKQTRNDYTIQATSQSCPGVPVTAGPSVTRPPSLTPTQTSTPTPQKKRCNEECIADDECGYTLGGAKLFCRIPTGGSTKRCLLQKSDSPVCYTASPTPTKTPTPSPTKTPTPTQRVSSPTPTDAPPACSGKVTFMIDTSTTTSITNSVKTALGQLKAWKGIDKLQYRFLVFNEKPQLVTDFTSYDNFVKALDNPPSGPGTNIYAALRKLTQLGNQPNHAFIFATDGIPSYDSSGTCRYLDSQVMADITFKTSANTGTVATLGALSSNNCPNRKYGFPLSEVMDLLNSSKPNPLWAINLDTQSGSNKSQKSLMNYIAAKTTGKLGDGADVYATLDQATAPLCSGAVRSTGGATIPDEASHIIMSSFTLKNQSSSKSVESVTVKACNSSGENCQEFANPVSVAPGSTGRFSQVVPATIAPENRAIVTCDVHYTDGSSLPCPQKTTNDDGVQFDLEISDNEVEGDGLSFLQAADVNRDGVVNGIDYVICQKQIGVSGPKSCDIIADDLVNAQDFSIVVERLGQRVE